ncbi:PUA domain containing protein [Emticicia oligotrophica DSM 17448]|uniref:PUA domain containing protein n=1 Tax=Emticicia oligotrophica (strain DSM 17448 / CIP 109782 / MTCC 6937 / GPTSA100-15) TaxID=929562 RepID=A0ABM5MW38_EMTOG|nr:class I SAM-dependent rRNA methyltransferase [Emticicia oligotrophica]AFK01492.1 PUA domain containing protein [Emticicia oligotrophica DSM 17448]
MYAKVILQAGKEMAVQRLHPWIFSGAIAKTEGNPIDGDVVEVFDKKNNYLATGHFYKGSIAVKIFSYETVAVNEEFWLKKLSVAHKVRQTIVFQGGTGKVNCYRLVHGEGDGFPGLILDFYNGVVVFQAHTIGMWQEREKIVAALKEIYGAELLAIYDKSAETLPAEFAKNVKNEYLFNRSTNELVPHEVSENDHKFLIDWLTGQKTGFFLDQRDNRALLAQYAKGKKVLNSFCYSGGFSIYALKSRASLVHSVDVSKKAVELVNQNVALNFGETANHEAYAEDVMTYLKRNDQFYDVIILDPPAYAKNIAKRHNAVQGYKRLNVEGIKRLAKGGILFTFSCSQVVDRELFYNTIMSAALEVGRQVRVLHHLTQGADHPVNLFHPEGSYLKGLVLYVE